MHHLKFGALLGIYAKKNPNLLINFAELQKKHTLVETTALYSVKAMEFGQLVKSNVRNIFSKNHA